MFPARVLPHFLRATRIRHNSSFRTAPPREFRVVLDQETLYVDKELAEALGWDASKIDGVSLTLRGWAPRYFVVSRTGSESDKLARRTVESGHDDKVRQVLEYLKER